MLFVVLIVVVVVALCGGFGLFLGGLFVSLAFIPGVLPRAVCFALSLSLVGLAPQSNFLYIFNIHTYICVLNIYMSYVQSIIFLTLSFCLFCFAVFVLFCFYLLLEVAAVFFIDEHKVEVVLERKLVVNVPVRRRQVEGSQEQPNGN